MNRLTKDIVKLMNKSIADGYNYIILEESFLFKYDNSETSNFVEPLKNLGYRVFQCQSIFGDDDYKVTVNQNYEPSIFEYEF